jgi:hypothetical protein
VIPREGDALTYFLDGTMLIGQGWHALPVPEGMDTTGIVLATEHHTYRRPEPLAMW